MEDWEVKVIVAASQKGGSGKTTLVRSLAVAAEARHAPVVMLDTDPQGSLTSWYNRRPAGTPPPPPRRARHRSSGQLDELVQPPRCRDAAARPAWQPTGKGSPGATPGRGR